MKFYIIYVASIVLIAIIASMSSYRPIKEVDDPIDKATYENPWLTVQVYRDSVQLQLNGHRAILRDDQTIFNSNHTIHVWGSGDSILITKDR